LNNQENSMSKPDQASTDPPGPGAPAASTNEVSALLLEVLRNVNREVQTALELEGKALLAVVHFQQISIQLRTLADEPTISSGPATRAARPLA
jgi:hypothetical protein